MSLRTKLFFILLFSAVITNAQTENAELTFLRGHIEKLTSRAMFGRGYVNNGVSIASSYLQQSFKEYGLKPLKGDTYVQNYSFDINTFPGKMKLVIDDKELQPGADYLVDARNNSLSANNLPIKTIDMAQITEIKELKNLVNSFDSKHAFLLLNFDSCFRALSIAPEIFINSLRKGCYLIAQSKKLTWDCAQETQDKSLFYIRQEAIPANPKKVSIDVTAKLVSRYKNENIIGYIPGTVNDSFVVFSAHYDHLGMMGETAMFPGASDNASGVAMLLYLASYFSKHPAHYSVVLMAFSGEEVGLLGSDYFVRHPLLNLRKIKFLTNIDIMGDASDGVTVVNAAEFPDQYKLLEDINTKNKYLPGIYSRGKAAISDHYFFTEAGVPSFYIYSRGGKGYYHDIFDAGSEVTLNHVDGMTKLMADFIEQVR